MASPGVLESSTSEISVRLSQPAAERVDGSKLLAFDAIQLLTKSVQNDTQCQANVKTTPGSNDRNNCAIGQSPFNDRPALQSLQEDTTAPFSSFTDSSQPLEHESTVVAHGTSDILPQLQKNQGPSMSSQERSQTALNGDTSLSDMHAGHTVNNSQFPSLTLMDDLFASPEPTQMSEYLSSAEPVLMDEFLSSNDPQFPGLLYMDDIFALGPYG